MHLQVYFSINVRFANLHSTTYMYRNELYRKEELIFHNFPSFFLKENYKWPVTSSSFRSGILDEQVESIDARCELISNWYLTSKSAKKMLFVKLLLKIVSFLFWPDRDIR